MILGDQASLNRLNLSATFTFSTTSNLLSSDRARGLTRGAPVHEARVLAHRAHPDHGPAAWAGSAAPAVHRSPAVTREPALKAARNVRAHRLAGGIEDEAQALVVEDRHQRPGIDAASPQRLAAVDIADAGGDALIEQHLADGPGPERPRARDRFGDGPSLGKDVRSKVTDSCADVADEL